MRAVWAALTIVASSTAAMAQSATADSTTEIIADKMAEIHALFPAAQWNGAGVSDEAIRSVTEAAIKKVIELRDALASNPYVRVSSFSVGLPAGVSVEFTFPPKTE